MIVFRHVAVVPMLFSLIAGCAQSTSSIETVTPSGDELPKPTRVIVYDFAGTPDDIAANSPVHGRFERRATPQTADERRLGELLGDRIADKLIEDFWTMGIPAERDGAGLPPRLGDLVVRGELVSIDQGNRARRMLIGFGAGAASLQTLVEVYQVGPDGLIEVGSGTVEAGGGRMPGMLVPIGAGAAAGSVATSAAVSGGLNVLQEAGPEGIGPAADRAAAEISSTLRPIFVERGWIAP